MYIKRISLANFRNYDQLEFMPSDGLNILVGSNAQGKSAILEAIYLLATSKSHRTSRDADLVKIGQISARASADVVRTARNDVLIELTLSRVEKKTVKINKVKHPKVGDVVGQLNATIFSNSDIDMVRGEPSHRRRFLNLEIAQISPQYVYSLGRYKRVLEQRNNLLREIKHSGGNPKDLDTWDQQLAQYGAAIIVRRHNFVQLLAKSAADIYSSLTDNVEPFEIAYKPNVPSQASESEGDVFSRFCQTLAVKRSLDALRGTTSVGPHRDDVSFTVAGLAAREYASQGQQRTAAIALKLAEIELMSESAEENPVVLLDDVMAELDETRRTRILDLTLGRCQTFITTTTLDDISRTALDKASVFEVRAGKVEQK